MSVKTRNILLGIYDMLVAIGAIYFGVKMVGASFGLFIEYPEEWLGKLPFKDWIPFGIVAIMVFGVGNILASVSSFIKKRNPWMSIVMGLLVIICIFAQIAKVGWYLASLEIMIVGVVQLLLCAMVVTAIRKEQAVSDNAPTPTDVVMDAEEIADKDDVTSEPVDKDMHEKEEDGSSSYDDEDIVEPVEDDSE